MNKLIGALMAVLSLQGLRGDNTRGRVLATRNLDVPECRTRDVSGPGKEAVIPYRAAAVRLVSPKAPLPLKRECAQLHSTGLKFARTPDDQRDMFDWKDEYSVHVIS